MLFLWGLLGLLLAVAALMPLPLTLASELHWPGFSEAQVRLGPVCLSRWHAAGPRLPHRRPAKAKAVGAKTPLRPGPAQMAQALHAFFAVLGRSRISQARLRMEGGVGDPAATAVLYGAAWALAGGAATAGGAGGRLEIVPRLEGPATGSLEESAEVTVTPWQLATAAFTAIAALRRRA